MDDLLTREFLGIRLTDVGLSVGLLVAAIIVGKITEGLIKLGTRRTDANSVRHAVLDALVRPVGWGVYVVGMWAAVTAFPLPKIRDHEDPTRIVFDVDQFVATLFVAATAGLVTWFAVRLTDRLTGLWLRHAETTESAFDDQLVPVVRKSGKVLFITLGAVMVVQNLGYSVTSLVAGIGLGGAALALASRDTVANLFGSIVIFVDRPFQIGDWVEIGEVEGTVEEVGLRVTRIRTFANSLITVPNAQLTTTAINNWSRMRKRRIKMNVGISYDATPEQVLAGRDAIRRLIDTDARMHSDFYLVNLNEFGDSALNYFIYCFTVTTNWTEYMETREAFLLGIMREFSKIGLEFAFPSQSLYVEKLPERGPVSMTRSLPR